MPFISSMSANHHWASVDEIERVRFKDVDSTIRKLISLPGVSEAMVLQTCNRVEVYAVADDPDALKSFTIEEGMPFKTFRFFLDDDSLYHLLRLACGIDSMIIGEDQILGQLKTSFLLSQKHGAMGPTLSTAILKAISVGKRARQDTRINKGSVSIGSAAVDLAEDILGSLDDKVILVVGAGEMGTLVANALAEKKLKAIYVANRTFKHAEELAGQLGGIAVKLDDISDYLIPADVIICATAAPHLVITKRMLEEKINERGNKKLLIIDITNPRNVEETVSDFEVVQLHNIDSLRRISDANLEKRHCEIAQVEVIIKEEFVLLKREYKRHQADRLISDLYKRTDDLRMAELNRAVSKLISSGGLTEKQMEILCDFSFSLTNKILASPTRQLRLAAEKGDEDRIKAAMTLFDIDTEEINELSYNKAKAVKTE
ncbi:glutamyl-tRNA reductase [Methanocella sp. CWC-04]|uniref:Glutamyl-tRNA reductase n=1 Tax=Methanooceanicella nereidis TaxID=2052831 RepID=A0AAP2W8Q7_9EURY|nr:glutamyl-tRNA reductase [Methanocella sp. CWC-04]MCD1296261.1 glutamyl-tRNA reductase [Methanocella sp. CWC-04]